MTSIIKAVAPRLSDEDRDPIEEDEIEGISFESLGYLIWDNDDIADVKRIINERMPKKQSEILNAFLQGLSYNDLNVSEKYWRHNFSVGIEFLKKELGI